jgi:hypothetical protein
MDKPIHHIHVCWGCEAKLACCCADPSQKVYCIDCQIRRAIIEVLMERKER